MSSADARLPNELRGVHPLVQSRRLKERALLAASVVLPLVLALAVAVEVKKPSIVLVVGVLAAAVSIVALVVSTRYEISVVVVILYLGLLEGYAKLGTGSHQAAAALRDVLIVAICLGAGARILSSREKIRFPPLTGWVMAWIGVVAVEAFNPKTGSFLHVIGGYSQQLEWVPFFFFAYALIRTRTRFRALILVMGVVALANGAVSAYQYRLSPHALAAWGPGYRELVLGVGEEGQKGGLAARTFSSEGEARVRPPALGTDAGFGGGVGGIALPATLALLATGTLRRRWPVIFLSLGAILGIVTGLGRLQVVGSVLAVMAFIALSFSAGRRVTRPLAAIFLIIVLTVPVIAVLVAVEGGGGFSRYTSIEPENAVGSKDKKTGSLEHIPAAIAEVPFGEGLGTVGAVAGLGGKTSHSTVEGKGLSAETEYNFIVDEVGLPGLVVWVAFTIRLLVLGVKSLRRVPDLEIRIYMAALFASFIALTIEGFSGPTTTSAALGPFFFMFAGLSSYWFLGPGRDVPRDMSFGAPTSTPAAVAA
jgi:hypothetical protein